jgi:hypothetical protein
MEHAISKANVPGRYRPWLGSEDGLRFLQVGLTNSDIEEYSDI